MLLMYIFNDLEFISYKYYGISDYASNIFIKNIIDNLNLIENNIENINSPINDQNDFYQFLWFLSFHKFILEINGYKIEDNIKKRLIEINKKIDYSFKRFVLYLNSNYKIVFNIDEKEEVKWYEYFDDVLQICYNTSTGIKDEVFDYIEKYFYLDLLSNFSYCEKYYKKHKLRLPNLFINLLETRVFDDNIYIDFLLKQINIDDSFYKEKAEFICERSIIEFKRMQIDSNNQSIFRVFSLFEKYNELAKYYKLKCANEFNFILEELIKVKDEFLIKNGQHVKIGPIDLKPGIELLKENNDPYKFFQLTHKLVDSKYFNNLDEIFSSKKTSSLLEFVNQIGRPRSDKYPYYKQDSMEINMWLQVRFINLIMCDEQLKKEFGDFIVSICHEVETKFFDNKITISNELIGQYEILLNIISLAYNKSTNTPLYTALINGCVMNLCALIEKLIRNIKLIEVKNKMYFDADSFTLVSLLKDNIQSLSEGLKYYLEFYLCLEFNVKLKKSDRPGKNIRNIQMHNHNMKYEKTNYEDCCIMFYFVLSIINDLIILPYNHIENRSE